MGFANGKHAGLLERADVNVRLPVSMAGRCSDTPDKRNARS